MSFGKRRTSGGGSHVTDHVSVLNLLARGPALRGGIHRGYK